MSNQQIFLCAGIAFGLTALATPLTIPFLRRWKAGQSIREEGPRSHLTKAGTPTMGGIVIVLSVVAASALSGYKGNDLWVILAVFLGFAAIGFIDDFVKVAYKRNLGLTAKQKLALQILLALLVAVYQSRASEWGTSVYIPILKTYADFGWLYVPFVVFVVVAMVNAVNLTDGLDGLAAGVTALVAACLAVVAFQTGFAASGGFAASMSGACIGFLLYNRHPAKVFMGDTGSLALGGGLAAAAILMHMEFILAFAGGIYVAEALSVLIQVVVFKTRNQRRFFRMAPLHHHFELGGWSETKVVYVFYFITFILCALALMMI